MQLLGDVGLVESRSVHLEMVLVLMWLRYTVSAKHTIGLDIIFAHPMELLGDIGHVESRSVRLDMVLVLM